MGFLKTLFTGHTVDPEATARKEQENRFDLFKFDGIKAMRTGQIDYAIACFEHALAIQDDMTTRRYYAQALLSSGTTDKALEQLEHIMEMDSTDTHNMLLLSELYYQTENYDKAESYTTMARERDSTLALPHYIMAKIHRAKKDPINAIAQVTQAIMKKEDYYEAYYLRAQILYDMGQWAEAEKDIDITIEHMEESSTDEILLAKANICKAQAKLDEALGYYNQVIEFNPYVTEAYREAAGILISQDKKAEATEMLAEGLKMTPDEMKTINGEYSNAPEKMKEAYNAINPYGLGVHI